MNVSLRRKNRYEFKKKYGVKASMRYLSHMIIFEKDWFYSLGPKARCAALVHELWHAKTRIKSTAALQFVQLMILLGWPLFAVLVGYGAGWATGTRYIIAPLFLAALLFFESYGTRFLFRTLVWPSEYQSDEAAVRYIGADATEEELRTLKRRTPRFWSTHPPTKARLERVRELAPKYPTAVINFAKLEADCPQELLLH